PPVDGGMNSLPEWAPLAALGALAVLLGGGAMAFARRRKRPLALPAPDDAPIPVTNPTARPAESADAPPAPVAAPAPDAPPTIAPAPAAPRPIIGRRADLALSVEASSAQSTLLNLRIRYAITLRNQGSVAASPITLRIGMFAGNTAHPDSIGGWMLRTDEPPHQHVDSIAPGQELRIEGELAAPLDALNPLTIDTRRMAIPVVAVDARYHHGPADAPLDGQVARAYVVGRDSGVAGGKLAPFRIDQGPTAFAPLGVRDTGISKTE
ncbi:MAG: hypothetical protein ACKOUM_04560, partial [Sphingopyxis sp.]